MGKTGFIGCGSMGSMLLEGFLSTGGLAPEDAVVATRTLSKLDGLRARWPGVAVARRNVDAAMAQRVFLCVKPLEVRAVLEEIGPALSPGTHLISIAGTVPIEAIEGLAGCAVTKLVPSVTSEVRGGVSLICHGSTVAADDAAAIEAMLLGIGAVKRLPEPELALATELTSCMPGFIASIFREMTEAALRHTQSLCREDAQELIVQALLGTARLFAEKGLGFDETIARVATRGGITEEGVAVFRTRLPQVFDEMFDKTLEKREAVSRRVEESFRV